MEIRWRMSVACQAVAAGFQVEIEIERCLYGFPVRRVNQSINVSQQSPLNGTDVNFARPWRGALQVGDAANCWKCHRYAQTSTAPSACHSVRPAVVQQ